MEKRPHDGRPPSRFTPEVFERLGLSRTASEPLHVYCARCGVEIDPLNRHAWETQSWWLCPRGCNRRIH